MANRSGILLTGATGLLGRYLLRDLLQTGHSVAVLVRDTAEATGRQRIAELLALWNEHLGRRLPEPTVLGGDLTLPGLGLAAAERAWLSRHCNSVVHSAANLSHHNAGSGEPWETNVNGTRRVLELVRSTGITAVHHVSTAFVYGSRRGQILEDELDLGDGPSNVYEQSKHAAEQLWREAADIKTTIYRPSIIVGDSRTGFTSSYHHFYRFLEMGVRLSARAEASDARSLPFRLPLTGQEIQNLVTVDWVSEALVEILLQPRWHGRTFHLVARRPAAIREIVGMVAELLHLEGIEWAGTGAIDQPTTVERLVLEQFRPYWAHLQSSPLFDCRNTQQALPDLPPPELDRALVAHLLEFARADRWGRRRTVTCERLPESFCAHYLERLLPQQVSNSALTRVLPPAITFAVEIGGPGGGRWSCCREQGGDLRLVRDQHGTAEVTYRTDAETFTRLVCGRQSPQEAFFAGRVAMTGDLEKGLKLAAMFEQFLTPVPYPSERSTELAHAAACTN